jgi:hypothetical protein
MSLIIAFLGCLCLSVSADEKPADAKALHLFILSGQSNMTPTLGYSFSECVQATLGKEQVVVVRTGHPGNPLKNWVKDWSPPAGMTDEKSENNGILYDRLMDAVSRALKDRVPTTVTFVWMQGEADAGRSWGSVYEKSFLSLLDQIKTDLEIKRLNFVVGRINDYWLEKPDGKLVREVLVRLGDEHANGAWIDTDDLNRGVNPWGGFSFEDGHYPPAGYVVMGQRMAKQACLLIDPDLKLDPEVYAEHFIDSHEDIATHAAIGKTVSGIEGELGLLTDGKFAAADHRSKGWVHIAPGKEPVELLLDLGEPMVIGELGVNMLVSSEAKAEFPASVTETTSLDGREFVSCSGRFGSITFYEKKKLQALRAEGMEPQSVLLLRDQVSRRDPDRMSRYAKIVIETGDQHVFIDEIVVNPMGE